MSCCAPGAESLADPEGTRALPSPEELVLASRRVADGQREARLSVPAIHCGACLRTVENMLARVDGVLHARANLTGRSVTVRWRDGSPPPPIAETLAAAGYPPHVADGARDGPDPVQSELVRALAVAGFASGNIMLLSVSVWAGTDPAMRDVFHALSALIALPALLYSGRVFYRSAWQALRRGRTNMDVPISIGIALAFALSVYDTITGGPHAYFDASVMLLLFLLVGRTLDHAMRARANAAVEGLARLSPRGATVEREDGATAYLPVGEIVPGMTVIVAAGDRLPVDGRVLSGVSQLDRSLVTGENLPVPVSAGAVVEAGTLNLSAPLRIEATGAAEDSFLAETVRLMAAAEGGRSAYRRIADRAAALYAPFVHATAILALLAWFAVTGDLHRAITIAVAVLIITCPCALGLAVPIVQVIATRRLFDHGVMVKDGAALERLAGVDTAVFDKTGTLTLGVPRLRDGDRADPGALALAATLAAWSRHPHARALAAAHAAGDGRLDPAVEDVREYPGDGLEARRGTDTVRLGRADWALAAGSRDRLLPAGSGTVLAVNGRLAAAFAFDERLRAGTREAITVLRAEGIGIEILSGDNEAAVAGLAGALGVDRFRAGIRPEGKLARLNELAAAGHKALMIGDGLNDANAFAAATVSMAPSTAVDVGRNAADFVFLRESLDAAPLALATARRAGQLIRQNLAIAVLYNAVALPFAIAGLVTPLVAALAMSSSSLIVVVNALRLDRRPRRRRPVREAAWRAEAREGLAR
jgi:Cu2+-exporting ATPase